MGKGKKGGKRMNKAQLTEMLQEFFAERPGETLSFKEIFRSLRLTTHPLKMLAIDIMEEMAWDDYLAKVSDNSYRLNQSIQVMEGKFVRKANGKNSVIPDDSEKPIFVSERNSMGALNGDRVEFTFLARRKNHIKEAQVNKILERAKDTFVGRLKVDKDLAYLVTPGDVFAHNIIIPRRKVKGGKTDDKAVVRIIEWPDGENKSPIGEVVDILGQMSSRHQLLMSDKTHTDWQNFFRLSVYRMCHILSGVFHPHKTGYPEGKNVSSGSVLCKFPEVAK